MRLTTKPLKGHGNEKKKKKKLNDWKNEYFNALIKVE